MLSLSGTCSSLAGSVAPAYWHVARRRTRGRQKATSPRVIARRPQAAAAISIGRGRDALEGATVLGWGLFGEMIADHGVEGDGDLAHAGDESDFARLSIVAESA